MTGPVRFCAGAPSNLRAYRDVRREAGEEKRSCCSFCDLVTRHLIEGWAFEPADPDARLTLAILAKGAVIGRVLADRYRPDLEAAGIGDGGHAFRFEMPRGFTRRRAHEVEVRRAADGTPLPESPVRLEAAEPRRLSAA